MNDWRVRNGMCKFINGNLNLDLNQELFNIAKNNLKNVYFCSVWGGVSCQNIILSDKRIRRPKIDTSTGGGPKARRYTKRTLVPGRA